MLSGGIGPNQSNSSYHVLTPSQVRTSPSIRILRRSGETKVVSLNGPMSGISPFTMRMPGPGELSDATNPLPLTTAGTPPYGPSKLLTEISPASFVSTPTQTSRSPSSRMIHKVTLPGISFRELASSSTQMPSGMMPPLTG